MSPGNSTLEGSCHCGGVIWRFDSHPASATSCNCTGCRRYGTIWAYGHQNLDIIVEGTTASYRCGTYLEFHFCPICGCNTHWLGQETQPNGHLRLAVNLRLAEPEAIADIPIKHFDGLTSFKTLASNGRCVRDMWF